MFRVTKLPRQQSADETRCVGSAVRKQMHINSFGDDADSVYWELSTL